MGRTHDRPVDFDGRFLGNHDSALAARGSSLKPEVPGEWIITVLLFLLALVIVYEVILFVIALTQQVLR